MGEAEAPEEEVGEQRARLRLRSGGEIAIDRAERRVLYRVPHPVRPDELVHPYLAPAAAVIARWMGRESMHAGAFAAGGQALGVVGTREAGKSSTLAWLARAGVDVLCDDMLIVDGDAPVAGPALDRPARRRGRAPGRRRADRDDRRARALAAAARPDRRASGRCAAGSSSPGATASPCARCRPSSGSRDWRPSAACGCRPRGRTRCWS